MHLTTSSRGSTRPIAVVTVIVVGIATLIFGLFDRGESRARLTFFGSGSTIEVPVVVVVFDELPVASLMTQDREIDARMFPGFARLASVSTWFRDAATTGVFTKDALPALLTGAERDDDIGMTDPHPRNLFTLLGGDVPLTLGHPLPGFCPVAACAPEPGSPVLDLGERFKGFASSERGLDLTRMLGPLSRAGDGPGLYFAHVVLPHSPWRYLPSGQRYFENEPEPGEVEMPGPGKAWADDDWLVTQVQQRHLLQLGVVDRLVNTLLETMEEAGILEESLLIVTADHGIAFEPGLPKRVVTDPKTLSSVAYVPLFVKEPGQLRGTTDDGPASLLDVLPTIVDALDVETDWSFDGRSLLRPLPDERIRKLGDLRLQRGGASSAVATKYSRFGGSGESIDPFVLGPEGWLSLLGGSPEDIAASPEVTATIDGVELYETARPEDRVFPALIEGTVEGATEPQIVAIVVNDRIVAVTRTYRRDGETRYYAMAPPRAFGGPPNEVHAIVVEDR